MAKDLYNELVKPNLEYIKEIARYTSHKQIAENLGISTSSMKRYRKQHKELEEALIKGKQNLIKDLKSTLVKKALGYTVKDVEIIKNDDGSTITKTKVKHIQPDLGSIHLLLKNLDDEWHNDDIETIKQKNKLIELNERKINYNEW